jgi:MFS family permease
VAQRDQVLQAGAAGIEVERQGEYADVTAYRRSSTGEWVAVRSNPVTTPSTPTDQTNSYRIMSNGNNDAVAPNAHRLLWAGFMAILAAGVGFGVRGGILDDWSAQFGFTQQQSGEITGFGLVGFGLIILFGALLADVVGYGKLMIAAFLCHFVGAALCLGASPAYGEAHNQAAAYNLLKWGQILFSIGNGLAEAVVNPLVATCFPRNRTHYLNILHAGWPAGLVLGSLANYAFDAKSGVAGHTSWEVQWALFLVPVVLYGVMCLGQNFPKSEASTKGVGIGSMLSEFAAPLLLFLLFVHALVGYAELQPEAIYNTADLIGPEGRILSYRKSHLPFIGIDRFTAPGNELEIVETKFGKIGILICYDQRAPENARTLALKGADLILIPTNWPEGAEMSANHISRARAAENHVFYACCNRVGTEKGTRFIGQSKILNPSGKTLAEAGDGETTIRAEFDLAIARDKRVVIEAGIYEYDVFQDRRPDLYEPITKKEAS